MQGLAEEGGIKEEKKDGGQRKASAAGDPSQLKVLGYIEGESNPFKVNLKSGKSLQPANLLPQ